MALLEAPPAETDQEERCERLAAGVKAGSTLASTKESGGISSGSAAPSCTSDAVRPRIPPTQKVRQPKED